MKNEEKEKVKKQLMKLGWIEIEKGYWVNSNPTEANPKKVDELMTKFMNQLRYENG